MRTMLRLTAITLGTLGLAFNLGYTGVAFGETSASAPKEETFDGIAKAINQQNSTVSVKDFWGTKTFNIATTCKVSLQDKPEASLADLHRAKS